MKGINMPARDPVLEQEILSNPRRLAEGLPYAKDVLQRRWTEWEEEVLRWAKTRTVLLTVCVQYAAEMIKGRWPDLEPVLFDVAGTDPKYENDQCADAVVDYARDVIQGSWTLFDSQILNGKCRLDIAVTYTAQVRGGPWTDFENVLLGAASDDAMLALAKYASEVHNGAWQPAETYFVNHPNDESLTSALYYYARHAAKGELSEPLHAVMLFTRDTDPTNNWVESYFEFLKTL
jgi:hypothetical protein